MTKVCIELLGQLKIKIVISQYQQTVGAKICKLQKVSDTLKLAGHHHSLLFVHISHYLSDLQVCVYNLIRPCMLGHTKQKVFVTENRRGIRMPEVL